LPPEQIRSCGGVVREVAVLEAAINSSECAKSIEAKPTCALSLAEIEVIARIGVCSLL
jgi:hypothetical protein